MKQQRRRSITAGMADIKNGYTYTWRCEHAPKGEMFICFDCHAKECERWHRMGKRDARRSAAKRTRA